MKQKKRSKKNTTPQNSGEPVEPQVLLNGIVTRSTGSWYMVRENDGKIWECRIVGKFRLDNMILTNPVAVGDEVQFFAEVEEENKFLREQKKEMLPEDFENFIANRNYLKQKETEIDSFLKGK